MKIQMQLYQEEFGPILLKPFPWSLHNQTQKLCWTYSDPLLPSGVLSRLALAASPTATRKLLHLKIEL